MTVGATAGSIGEGTASIVLRADGSGVRFNGKAGDVPTIKFPPILLVYDVGVDSPNRPTVLASPTSFVLSGELPDGLVFDSETGVISGTPNEIASERILAITATNANGDSDPLNFKVSVADLSVPVHHPYR